MRSKKFMLIITFSATTSAMAMEKLCVARGLPGRLIPVPRDITAGCGMAWCAPVQARSDIQKAAEAASIETSGWYEMMV